MATFLLQQLQQLFFAISLSHLVYSVRRLESELKSFVESWHITQRSRACTGKRARGWNWVQLLACQRLWQHHKNSRWRQFQCQLGKRRSNKQKLPWWISLPFCKGPIKGAKVPQWINRAIHVKHQRFASCNGMFWQMVSRITWWSHPCSPCRLVIPHYLLLSMNLLHSPAWNWSWFDCPSKYACKGPNRPVWAWLRIRPFVIELWAHHVMKWTLTRWLIGETTGCLNWKRRIVVAYKVTH